ncbi:phenylacetic acid degradation-like protein [Salinisphaera dokdonensis CL-ES53]|uniref:Phenylacetic acid degradation-like protein n=1 Tax=Salinisphaera dokdonensis CL-ES53 TaxID=1304272 RepID=A0ABV2B299_9GAMM
MQANRLDDWLAVESRLAQAASNNQAAAIDPAHSSGLELLQGALDGPGLNASIGRTLDFRLVEVSHGRAVFQGAPSRDHYNPLGTVHGGWFAALLDSAVGCAVHSTLEAGQSYTTLELKVNYVRALTDRVSRVRAIGEVIHRGRRVATAEARLVGPDDTLYAHATTTCLVIDTEAAA